ncbi:hypothetical protein BK005_00340 [bacterium CG10_37_50]|nr:MAG: hypothetical protein BK005_00340 [bacterium CG10_37_50]
MKKYTILTVMIIVLLIIVGGTYYYSQNKNNNFKISDKILVNNFDSSKTEEKQNTGSVTSLIESNIQQCNDVRDLQARYKCYVDLAVIKGAQICEYSPVKQSCYEQLAIQKNDYTICEYSPAKRSCYGKLAIQKKDYTICQVMNDSDYNKDACMFEVMFEFDTSNYSICDAMTSTGPESPKTNCYNVASIRSRDQKYCQKIVIASEKDQCLQTLNLLQNPK